MSEMTVLLILVWDTSVNMSIVVRRAVDVPFKCCRDGTELFLRMVTKRVIIFPPFYPFLPTLPPSSTAVIKGNVAEALNAET